MELLNGDNKKIINILKGSLISFFATLIFLLVYAIILTYTNVSENTIFPVIVVITFVSILLGSSLANLKIKKNGLVNGAFIGLIYMFIIYIISSFLIGEFSLNINSIIVFICGIIAGIVGGIIGVNIGK